MRSILQPLIIIPKTKALLFKPTGVSVIIDFGIDAIHQPIIYLIIGSIFTKEEKEEESLIKVFSTPLIKIIRREKIHKQELQWTPMVVGKRRIFPHH